MVTKMTTDCKFFVRRVDGHCVNQDAPDPGYSLCIGKKACGSYEKVVVEKTYTIHFYPVNSAKYKVVADGGDEAILKAGCLWRRDNSDPRCFVWDCKEVGT